MWFGKTDPSVFRSPRSAPAELKETASFKQYIDFYTERVGLSENKLALCARLYQQRLNKISNGKIKNANIETLVCICLPLGLDVTEAKRPACAIWKIFFTSQTHTHGLFGIDRNLFRAWYRLQSFGGYFGLCRRIPDWARLSPAAGYMQGKMKNGRRIKLTLFRG